MYTNMKRTSRRERERGGAMPLLLLPRAAPCPVAPAAAVDEDGFEEEEEEEEAKCGGMSFDCRDCLMASSVQNVCVCVCVCVIHTCRMPRDPLIPYCIIYSLPLRICMPHVCNIYFSHLQICQQIC